MAGTTDGGKAAAESNKSKYGSDFYAKIGAKGGRLSRGGGFTSETARMWGKIGGTISRKRNAKSNTTKLDAEYSRLVDQLRDKQIDHSEFMASVEALDS